MLVRDYIFRNSIELLEDTVFFIIKFFNNFPVFYNYFDVLSQLELEISFPVVYKQRANYLAISPPRISLISGRSILYLVKVQAHLIISHFKGKIND